MFGFIKNLITGILNFFIGLFGGKKGGYYMELEEGGEQKQKAEAKPLAASNTKTETAKPAPNAKTEAAKPAPKTKTEAPTPVTSNAKKAPEAAKAASSTATKETQTNTSTTVAQPAPAEVELVQTANGVKAEPAKKDKASATPEQPTETTFAPKYLAVPSNTNGRRRPGANMNSFLDMARQVKTPG
jgi:membrane protein involved in colicin uptake